MGAEKPKRRLIFHGVYPNGCVSDIYHAPLDKHVTLVCRNADGDIVLFSDGHITLVDAQIAAGNFWAEYEPEQMEIS